MLREVGRVDRSRLAPAVAAAGAVGFALPLALGLATGHVADGIVASAGALIVGFANLGGSYPVRATTLLATTAATTLAALLGLIAADSVPLSVALLGGWGFCGALLVAFGTRPAFVGMLSTWALLLGGDLGMHGAGVLHDTALIAAGGLLSTTVALLPWPLRPYGAERRATAAAYRALAAYARDPGPERLAAAAAALTVAGETVGFGLAGPAGRGALRARVEQGEWIRMEMAALDRAGGSVEGADDRAVPLTVDSPGAQVRRVLDRAATGLDEIAASLEQPREPRCTAVTAVAELREVVASVSSAEARRRAATLAAWIGAAAERREDGLALDPSPRLEFSAALAGLRERLPAGSPSFRHAVRLATALTVGAVAYRALSLGFGYWVPLTILFVLKPDHVTTYSRGIGRLAGTMLGVALAWSLLAVFSPSDVAIVALLAVLALAAYALYPANYALFSVVLTILVALLAEFGGGSAVGALEDRLLDTALGGAIALGAFALWPTREAPRLGESLAALVDAQRLWLTSVLGALGDGIYEPRVLRERRLRARRTRSSAEAALERAVAEPSRRRPDPGLPREVLSAVDRIGESTLALTAAIHLGVRSEQVAVAAYERAVVTCLGAVSASLREGAWKPLPLPESETRALSGGANSPAEDTLAGVLVPEAGLILAALERLDREGGVRPGPLYPR